MAPTTSNHRLLAREHLAEAAALAEEARFDDCRQSLLAAAGHSIGQLAADHAVEAPSIARAIAVLSLRGVLPFDARPLWSALLGESGRSGPPAPGLDASEAIAAVQTLVDLAAGVPGAPRAEAVWQRWGAPPEDLEDSGGGEPLPARATGWTRAVARERARRRGRRARLVTVTAACAVGLGLLGLAWSDAVDGTAYRPAKADIGFYDSGS